jgi:urease accessory protein
MQRSHGTGRLSFKRRDGLTVLDHLYEEGCAKIRFPEPDQAILINTAGGLTGGDSLAWVIELPACGDAVITTQASDKVYRAIAPTVAKVATRIALGPRARLHWLPQETILFNDSALERTFDVALAEDACFLAAETIVFGRKCMHETMQNVTLRDRWRVSQGGRLVHAEDFRIAGGPLGELLARKAVGDGNAAFATIVFIAEDAERYLDATRAAIGEAGGASAFAGKLLARIAAQSAYALRKSLITAISALSGGRLLPKIWAS